MSAPCPNLAWICNVPPSPFFFWYALPFRHSPNPIWWFLGKFSPSPKSGVFSCSQLESFLSLVPPKKGILLFRENGLDSPLLVLASKGLPFSFPTRFGGAVFFLGKGCFFQRNPLPPPINPATARHRRLRPPSFPLMSKGLSPGQKESPCLFPCALSFPL